MVKYLIIIIIIIIIRDVNQKKRWWKCVQINIKISYRYR